MPANGCSSASWRKGVPTREGSDWDSILFQFSSTMLTQVHSVLCDDLRNSKFPHTALPWPWLLLCLLFFFFSIRSLSLCHRRRRSYPAMMCVITCFEKEMGICQLHCRAEERERGVIRINAEVSGDWMRSGEAERLLIHNASLKVISLALLLLGPSTMG